MTGKLDRLEQQGLVEPSPDPEDRRAIRLGITDTGRTLIDQAFDISLSMYQSMVENLTAAEIANIETILERLLTRLEELSGT